MTSHRLAVYLYGRLHEAVEQARREGQPDWQFLALQVEVDLLLLYSQLGGWRLLAAALLVRASRPH